MPGHSNQSLLRFTLSDPFLSAGAFTVVMSDSLTVTSAPAKVNAFGAAAYRRRRAPYLGQKTDDREIFLRPHPANGRLRLPVPNRRALSSCRKPPETWNHTTSVSPREG